MRQSAFLIATLALVAPVASANSNEAPEGTPTYYGAVQELLAEKCQVCHRPNGANLGGMVAPMAFTSYAETRPWARSIARQVEAGEMPPWHASPNQTGVFENERSLTAEQKEMLIAWARGGAPMGDAAEARPDRTWPAGDRWSIGEPDLVLDIGRDYFVEDEIEDKYITFETVVTKEELPEGRWIKAIEFRPGSPAVHHIIAMPFGFVAPGNDPAVHDDGFAIRVEPGTKISWQMHYHKESGPGTGFWDRSSVGLRLYPVDYRPDHVIQDASMPDFEFEIPAGDPNHEVTIRHKFERDALLLGYAPHMHLRGKSARYVAIYPDGEKEELLFVPKYDFDWQTFYKYPLGGKRVPAGTEIVLTLAWDNSADNPRNPDPTVAVGYGGPTTSEMAFGLVSFADAEPGYDPLHE